MDTRNAIRTLRSVREFSDEPLSNDVTHAILNAGRRARSSKNGQPWAFIAIRDRGTLLKLAECGTYAGHLRGAALGVAIVSTEAWSFDIGQASAFMQLAAWELGVGSCVAAMWEPEKAKEVLGVPMEMHFEVALSFGFPKDEQVMTAVPRRDGRRTLDELVHWDHW